MRAALQPERGRPVYRPLDELLEMVPIRILRVLSNFDDVEADDLWLAFDLVGIERGAATSKHLGRLVKVGAVAQRAGGFSAGVSYLYRITRRGRTMLAATLDRARPERELGALSDEEAETGVPAWKVDLRKRMKRANEIRWQRARARGAA